MRIGDNSRVDVEAVGTVDVYLTDSKNRVRYTRPQVFYTPSMRHSLIPERREWKRYRTRVRKEDENVIHLPNGSVSMDDASGLYMVKYEPAAESQQAGVANVAQLSKHEKNFLKWHCRLGHPSNGKM